MYCKKGDSVYIQSFKHDGSLHRTWCKAFVLEEDDQKIVVVTDRAWVIESDGRRWLTRVLYPVITGQPMEEIPL